MLNAVGIDVSKGRSTVTVMQPGEKCIRKPFTVSHTRSELHELTHYLSSLDGDVKIAMEHTGRYHEPILRYLANAGLFVTAVNPMLIRAFDQGERVHNVKTDPADSRKIARYALDKWSRLREYSIMDTTREKLKMLNSQLDFLNKQKVAEKANLISILDETYPGVNKLFTSPARSDGSEKWVDFAYTFWHVDCVLDSGRKDFFDRYRNFCKHHHYAYQQKKAETIYGQAREIYAVRPKDPTYKTLIQATIRQLRATSENVESIRKAMNELASTLPEYETVMSMYGVGPTLGPQLMAEIGDVSRFTHREALTAYAGVDPTPRDDSGNVKHTSNRTTKRGSAKLRKTLYQIMDVMLKSGPHEDDPVSQFLFKKRDEGKPYLVYMTAGANKFLRVYYGKVRACLRRQKEEQSADKA